MARRSFLALTGVVIIGLGCAGLRGKPVPADRLDLIGDWSAIGVDLTITADGGVHYEKTSGTGSVKIDGPVTEWVPDGFVVGVFGVGTTFHVDEAPHVLGDHWATTIDGTTLTRSSPEPDGMPERRGHGRRQR